MKMTIYKKMMLGFSTIIVIMALASTYILIELHTVTNSAKTTLSSNVKSLDHAKRLKTMLYDEEGYAQKYLISGDRTYFDLLSEQSKQFDEGISALYALQPTEEESRILTQIISTHQFFDTDVRPLNDSTELPDPGRMNEKWYSIFESVHRQLDLLISLNQITIGKAMSQVETTTERSTTIAMFLTIATLLFALIIASYIAKTITKPIGDLIKGTNRVAKGNFEPVTIDSKDEIAMLAEAFNNMSWQLQKINEFKAEMMHQIAHELRTPLQIAQTSHDLLRREHLGKLNTKQIKLLDSLDSGLERISDFNNQYLDLAKVDAGMMEYKMELVDLVDIIKVAVNEAIHIASQKGISVNFNVEGTLPSVHADQEKIKVVFRNLLSNAIKYSPDNSRVDLHLSPSKFGIRAAVVDQGIGIPPEDLPRVFTRFFRAMNVGNRKSKGTGLGLALVKAYTEGHGGRILAQSTLHSGSTFIVELPSASIKLPKKAETIPPESRPDSD
jgi:signal transduction histidine kinase